MKILPLSTIDDNRTILQEVLRVRKYLEENPCRNVFNIDEDYDDGTIAYDKTKVFIPLDFDGSVEGGDVIIFKNSYIAVLDTVSTDYVVIKADTAVSIKGDKGDTGDTGATGNGISSITKTGTSGLVDTYTIAFTNGTSTTFTVTNGKDGENGADGQDGATGNGISSITKTGTSGLVDTYTIAFTNGTSTTFTVTNGANGQNGQDGQNGVGVPAGGTTGQVLKKKSNTDYDTEWGDESGGGSSTQFIGMPKNLIINPTFEINQRGITSFNSTARYTADRWYHNGSGSGSITSTANTGYRAEIAIGASLSQFVELNCVNMEGYLLVGATYVAETGYSQPIISLSDDQGNNRTPILTKTLNIRNGLQHKQILALFEVNSIVGSTYSSGEFKYIRIQYSSGVSDAVRLANAFCYALSEVDTTSLLSKPVFVVTPNYNEELEKCQYYYELETTAEIPCYIPSVTQNENGNVTTGYIRTLINCKRKRITPTVSPDGGIRYFNTSNTLMTPTTGAPNINFTNGQHRIIFNSYVSNITPLISSSCYYSNNGLKIDAEIYP